MKKRLSSFFAGMLTMALIGSLAIPVLASAGMTITVDPINVQVNGQTFAPKDVKGNDVPVFAYNGTTYAPLRALAEAYGLEVGYDSSTNMATVSEPGEPTPAAPSTDYSNWSAEEEAAYQEFKALWKVSGDGRFDARYAGALQKEDFVAWWNQNLNALRAFAIRMTQELKADNAVEAGVIIWYSYEDMNIGTSALYASGNSYCSFEKI